MYETPLGLRTPSPLFHFSLSLVDDRVIFAGFQSCTLLQHSRPIVLLCVSMGGEGCKATVATFSLINIAFLKDPPAFGLRPPKALVLPHPFGLALLLLTGLRKFDCFQKRGNS